MSQVFGLIGWAVLPSYATAILQSIYYKLTVPVGRLPPQPGTQTYATHHRRIRVLVLTLYLVYTLLQSLYDIRLVGDFYTILSVTPSTSDRDVKSRFRRLAAKYHPDKLRSGDDGSTTVPRNDNDLHFVLLKTAQDTLLSPPLRYAYNRFGPAITRVESPVAPTIRAYVLAGLRYHLVPAYFMNIAGLIVMNYLFLPKWGSYWRYLALSSIVLIEMYFLTHSDTELAKLIPSYVPIPQLYHLLQSRTKLGQLLPPHLLPFQIVAVLRNLSVSLNIFISQLAPPASARSASGDVDLNPSTSTLSVLSRINQHLNHIHQVALRTDAESTSLLHLQMAPFKGDDEQTATLRRGMSEGMITGAIQQHPEVRAAVERVVKRRKNLTERGGIGAGAGVGVSADTGADVRIRKET